MKAIILCAGKGERMRPLTEGIPKPMVEINGKPLLWYNLQLLKKHNIKQVAINTSHLPEKIKDYFGDGKKFGINITYSYEQELLGTSGALNNFKDFFNETFVVLYGDNLTDVDLTRMIQHHKKTDAIATIALRRKPKDYKTQSLILAYEDLRIKEFIEKPSDELVQKLSRDNKLINSGIYIMKPRLLTYIKEGFSDFAYDVFPEIIKKGEKVMGFIIDNYYFREVGKIEKYELAKNEIESGKVTLDFEVNSKSNRDGNIKNKAVFLDRDGVINELLYEVDGKLMSPNTINQLKILPLVKEGIQYMKKLGFKIIVCQVVFINNLKTFSFFPNYLLQGIYWSVNYTFKSFKFFEKLSRCFRPYAWKTL